VSFQPRFGDVSTFSGVSSMGMLGWGLFPTTQVASYFLIMCSCNLYCCLV